MSICVNLSNQRTVQSTVVLVFLPTPAYRYTKHLPRGQPWTEPHRGSRAYFDDVWVCNDGGGSAIIGHAIVRFVQSIHRHFHDVTLYGLGLGRADSLTSIFTPFSLLFLSPIRPLSPFLPLYGVTRYVGSWTSWV